MLRVLQERDWCMKIGDIRILLFIQMLIEQDLPMIGEQHEDSVFLLVVILSHGKERSKM